MSEAKTQHIELTMNTSDRIAGDTAFDGDTVAEGYCLYAVTPCTGEDFSVVFLCREFGPRWIPLSLFVGQLSIFCLWSSSSLLVLFQPSLFTLQHNYSCVRAVNRLSCCDFFLSLSVLSFSDIPSMNRCAKIITLIHLAKHPTYTFEAN